MSNQSVQNMVYQTGPAELPENDGPFQNLQARWSRVEAKAMELANYADAGMSERESDSPEQATLAQLSHKIDQEQHEILKALAETPATALSDLVAKLNVWKSMTCPTREDEDYLQPADMLVLSVLNDLAKLQHLN